MFFLKILLTLSLLIPTFKGYFHVNFLKDEISSINLFDLKNMKEFHLNYINEYFHFETIKEFYIKNEVLDHYYGTYNSVVVACFYNSVLYDGPRNTDNDIYWGDYVLGYKIKTLDDSSLVLKINNECITFIDAVEKGYVDEELMYFIHCEDAKFHGYKAQKKVIKNIWVNKNYIDFNFNL